MLVHLSTADTSLTYCQSIYIAQWSHNCNFLVPNTAVKYQWDHLITSTLHTIYLNLWHLQTAQKWPTL